MTIRLHDNQGKDWTVEGDWQANVIGADFDGRGQIMCWIRPISVDAGLVPAQPELPPAAPKRVPAHVPELPSGAED